MKNKISCFAIIIIGFLFLNSCKSDSDSGISSPESFTFEFNNTEREYIMYLPPALPENAALVFVLHGFTGSAKNIMYYSNMNKTADKNNFAVCYPQGSLSNKGDTYWNARLDIGNTDDIGFLSELALFLQEKYNFDSEKTFCCGHSNGGFMSYTLAAEKPEIFKAIASVAGTMSGYTWENKQICRAMPVMQIHGTDDKIVPIDGSMTTEGGWGTAPEIDSMLDFWRQLSNCNMSDSVSVSKNTTMYRNYNTSDKIEVLYYKIENHGHDWPNDGAKNQLFDNSGINASDEIWKFFSKY